MSVALVLSGAAIGIVSQKPPVSNARYDRQGWWVLGAGDNVQFVVEGATLNDDVYCNATGFAFAVNL
jgi:hypothetical protein